MLKFLGTAAAFCAAASLSYAAGLPSRSIHGNYVEARTTDVYTGPCFANGEVGLVGKLAVFGWKVDSGSWHGVNLDGLGVVGVVSASGTLGDVYATPFPVKAVLIVDSRAGVEQRLALQSFAVAMGGDLLGDVVKVDYAPIELEVKDGNVHTAVATLTAGSLAKIETRAIIGADQHCGNEGIWYPPLTKLEHSMPAYSLANSFSGDGLGETWSSPDRRSSFVGTFLVPSE